MVFRRHRRRVGPQPSCAAIGLLLVALAAGSTLGGEAQQAKSVALLDDTRFERGLIVWSPRPGRHVRQGVIGGGETNIEPVWGLAQWHSRFTLAGAAARQFPDGRRCYRDGAKEVTFFPTDGDADISLRLDGFTEYSGRAPERGDPWPHLLLERRLLVHPAVSDLQAVQLNVQYRLIKEDKHRPAGFDPRRHTAQFVFYITVQNRNRQSDGFGDYYWFGVPMYDARYRIPRAHKAKDKGSDRKPATGKFIFNPGGDHYTSQSAHDGQWVTISRDLLPLIREGLETAWQRGFLRDSRDTSDYRLMGMNTGWEVTGPLDVEMQLKGLRLTATLPDADSPESSP